MPVSLKNDDGEITLRSSRLRAFLWTCPLAFGVMSLIFAGYVGATAWSQVGFLLFVSAFCLPPMIWITGVYGYRIFWDDVMVLNPQGLLVTLRGKTKNVRWSDIDRIGYRAGAIMPFVTVAVLKASPAELPRSVAEAFTKSDRNITLPFLWKDMGWTQLGVGKLLEKYLREFGAKGSEN